MSRRWLAVAMLAAVIGAPLTARAAGTWRWPVDGDPVLLYGARYSNAAGTSCTHGGLDIGASAGSDVRSAAQGEVVFSGPVPAGEGARAIAVTVLTADGLRVTYLPLETSGVHRGQTVSAGQEIGTLAAAGDASGGASHLHLGVKRGEAALDPLSFLGSHGPAPAPAAASGVSAGVPAATGSRSGSPARSNVTAGSPALSREFVGSTAGGPVADVGQAPAQAVRSALQTLAEAPEFSRVEQVAAAPVLSLARVGADWDAARGTVLALAVRLGLLLLACACIRPVFLAARAAGAQAVPVAVRREHQ